MTVFHPSHESSKPRIEPERLHGGRAILEPNPENDWESSVVLNPAAALVEAGEHLDHLIRTFSLSDEDAAQLRRAGGACALVYRAQGRTTTADGINPSSLGIAVFTPRLTPVYRHGVPVVRPDAPFHELGAEDARCTLHEGIAYLYYTGFHRTLAGGRSTQICFATSRDFLTWRLQGPVDGDVNRYPTKNAALFPAPVDNRWMLLHRPMDGPDAMAVHLAEAPTPEGPWNTLGLLFRARPYTEFEKSWVGAAGPPIALGRHRFLAIYHIGHLHASGRRRYDLGACLIDFSSPDPVRARIEPLMRPETPGERSGDERLGVDDVLFSCGNFVWKGELVVPYGGADSRIFGASVPLDRLLRALEIEPMEPFAESP